MYSPQGASSTMDFVLTADIDWASEYCIEYFLGITDRFRVKPTLFVTHESHVIRDAVDAGRVELGIHPNFLPASTHGDNPEAVVDHLFSIVQRPLAGRCHFYLDLTHIHK